MLETLLHRLRRLFTGAVLADFYALRREMAANDAQLAAALLQAEHYRAGVPPGTNQNNIP